MYKHFEKTSLGAMDRYKEVEGLVMLVNILYITIYFLQEVNR
jgi:hypothetical protein